MWHLKARTRGRKATHTPLSKRRAAAVAPAASQQHQRNGKSPAYQHAVRNCSRSVAGPAAVSSDYRTDRSRTSTAQTLHPSAHRAGAAGHSKK